jgi:hypothetical protein
VTTLFSQNVSVKIGAYLFDLVLQYGEWEIMRVALAICEALKDVEMIKDFGSHLTLEQL